MSRWWPWLLLVLALTPAVLIRPARVPPPKPVAGAVTVALLSNPVTVDPAKASTPAEWAVADNVFQPLYRFNASGRLVPDLASSAQFTGHRVILHLAHRNLSNGQPVTAAMVAGSLARALEPSVHSLAALQLLKPVRGYAAVVAGTKSGLSGVTATSSSTLTLTLRKPAGPWFLRNLANPALAIVPPADPLRGGPDWQLTNLYGSGGYRLHAWNPSDYLSFERTGSTTGPEKVELVVYPSFHEALMSFVNQSLDIVPVAPEQLAGLPMDVRRRVLTLPVPGTLSLYLNPKAKSGIAAYPATGIRRWVSAAFSGHLQAVSSAAWPAGVPQGKPMTLAVNQSNGEAVLLAETLRGLEHGRVTVQMMTSTALMQAVRGGQVNAYLGIVDGYAGGGIQVPLAPMATFWLVGPTVAGARVYADGSLNWHSLTPRP
ncbi:MAG: ABC transporter substrate-binding protein [Thermaerobacter sp.]|nr:ABC transporter substrate-binding protein [Thermaerobacter sp.]